MDIHSYLHPVELERPDEHVPSSQEILGNAIHIHTENNPVGELSEFDIAILGVPEDRNSFYRGCSLAPNKVRTELYQLIATDPISKVIDLGNLQQGNTFNDTYYALKDVVYQCLCSNLVVVIVGGTHELTHAIFQAYELYKDKINLITVDRKIDFLKDYVKITPDSYLIDILLKKRKLFKYTNLAHQIYLTDVHNVQLINKLFHDAIRLGDLRTNMHAVEPIMRDGDLVSFDVGAVRHSDAPGQDVVSPNGLHAEEACQISKYAGNSNQVTTFGLFNINPNRDVHGQTAILGAQCIWHFIQGYMQRQQEQPSEHDKNFKTFIVGHSDLDHEITFYKSLRTDRWWMEVPNTQEKSNIIVPCSAEDYATASNQEVPDLWWRTYQKLC